MKAFQASAGAVLVAVGGLLAYGAASFRADASYSGIGPAFYPGLVAGLLALTGAWLIYQALTGGYRNLPDPDTPQPGHWRGFAIVSGGLLASAFLITRIGFVATCALLFAAVAYAYGSRRIALSLAAGFGISLIVFWIFARGLGLTLPALTKLGWI